MIANYKPGLVPAQPESYEQLVARLRRFTVWHFARPDNYKTLRDVEIRDAIAPSRRDAHIHEADRAEAAFNALKASKLRA